MEFVLWQYDTLNSRRPAYVSSPRAEGLSGAKLAGSDPLAPLWTKGTCLLQQDPVGIPDALATPLLVSESFRNWFLEQGLVNVEYLPVDVFGKVGNKKILKTTMYWVRPIRVTDCIDLAQSQAEMNLINPNRISSAKGLFLKPASILATDDLIRPAHLENHLLVRKSLMDKICKTPFTGVAFGTLESYTGSNCNETLYLASRNGHKVPLTTVVQDPKALDRAQKVADRFEPFHGQWRLVPADLNAALFDQDEKGQLAVCFLPPEKIKKALLSGYSDELHSLGLSDDGQSWDTDQILPLAVVKAVGKKGMPKPTASGAAAWLLYDGAKEIFFVCTTDHWAFDRVVKQIEGLLKDT